jgi:hypothetical protein
MSGHSKWATIKRKKGATDAARGKVFTKLIREVVTAARIGGGDIDSNPRLRKAVQDCRAQQMPADNIKRAIQRGTGEIEGASYDEVLYEESDRPVRLIWSRAIPTTATARSRSCARSSSVTTARSVNRERRRAFDGWHHRLTRPRSAKTS